MRQILFALAGIALSGCSLTAGLDGEIVSSIKYDHFECGALVAQRDALAARYGVAPDVRRDPVLNNEQRRTLGSAAGYLPDLRSEQTKEVERAKGQIEAMNGSLLRRQC